jgi:catechol 2,3-dioxygenase-like lactoylglutathione lyase family enzyme
MAIDTVVINVADVVRSVDFYTRFLGMSPAGEITRERARLSAVTADIELVAGGAATASDWEPDDTQRGFRHVGFKVRELDQLAARLKAAGIRFHLDPLDAEGEVRIAFFFDPDGTLLELVQGPLRYHEIADEAGVRADWALGVPGRPRFDHVALTVTDLAATEAHYAPFGFTRIGRIHQAGDPRGFEIDYLKSGDSVLEIFTYQVPTRARAPQLSAPGFAGVVFSAGAPTAGRLAGTYADGTRVYADADGFVYAARRDAP